MPSPQNNISSYYSLTTSDGKIITPAKNKTVIIGQNETCDIVLPNETEYEDAIIAKIIPTRNGYGWQIIKLSPFFKIFINGHLIHRTHYLENKDNIEIDHFSPTFKFNIEEGEQPATTIIKQSSAKTFLSGIAAIIILIAIVSFSIINKLKSNQNLSDEMLQLAETSVFRVRVDSIAIIVNDSVIDSYIYTQSPTGSGFLTTDSLFVTARHCIQPWLNTVDAGHITDVITSDAEPVQMALRVETYNQLREESEPEMRLVSYLTLLHPDIKPILTNSENFAIDTSNDEIIELGTFEEDFFWRNIQARYGREDMMLDDAVACKMPLAGNIELLDGSQFPIIIKNRTELTFIGFPNTQGNDSRPEIETDRMRQPLKKLETEKDKFFMLAHGGRLSPGYSGGPVLTRYDSAKNGFVAVGVISVLDNTNSHRSYSVPTTSVPKI